MDIFFFVTNVRHKVLSHDLHSRRHPARSEKVHAVYYFPASDGVVTDVLETYFRNKSLECPSSAHVESSIDSK